MLASIALHTSVSPSPSINVALIFALFFFVWSNIGTTKEVNNPELLFAEAYEPYPVSNTVRSVDDSTKTTLEIAQLDYKEGNYTSAIQSLTILLEDENLTVDDTIIPNFYRGLAYMGNQKYDEAKEDFNLVLETKNHSYTQQTQWYLALIALK